MGLGGINEWALSGELHFGHVAPGKHTVRCLRFSEPCMYFAYFLFASQPPIYLSGSLIHLLHIHLHLTHNVGRES